MICRDMTETITHRGPDDDGIWQDPDISMLLGHRRLSIIDLSAEGAQPMTSASDRYVIAYNGEIYNYLDIQKDLIALGTKFKGRSDTEVILAALDQWGLNVTLQKLNGMFAFALWDRKERILHLARDRMGKKPLYIGWAGDHLIFGSELKALRAHPEFTAHINRDTLALYMKYASVPAPHCIYKNTWSVPAGHILSLDVQALSQDENLAMHMKPYWHHRDMLTEAQSQKHKYKDQESVEEFDGLLTQCVKDRMICDVPLGAFLSGGLDSSAIVALMQKLSNDPIKTYSVGFEEHGFNEAPFAKKIATHLGTDHHELYLNGQDALDVIPNLPEIYDEPFGDISAIPTYLVSKFARRDVTVALSGDGGDEMLGGYNRHFMGPRIYNKTKNIPVPLCRLTANTIEKIPTRIWDKTFRNKPQFGTRMHKLASILPLTSEQDIYERLISHWPTPPVLHAAMPDTFLNKDDYLLSDVSFAEKMMYMDTLGYLPNDILVKVDRASMATSLECRAPLLDKRIYEFAWRLPLAQKIRKTSNGIQGKWILRQMLNKYIPAELFERPKQGFAIPVADWLRDPLREWAEDLLNEDSIAQDGLLDGTEIRKIWDAHIHGSGNHADTLWTVLMFQSWKRKWMTNK